MSCQLGFDETSELDSEARGPVEVRRDEETYKK